MNPKRWPTLFLPALALLAAALAAAPASAQQVRIVEDGTEIRLDPSSESPAVTVLSAGTVIDWIGESGAWYAVSLPGVGGADDVVGYVLANEVEVVGNLLPSVPGAPPSPGGPPPSPGMTGFVPDAAQQLANQRQRQSTGVKRAIQGGALAAAAEISVSIAFEVEERENYETQEAYQQAVDRAETGSSIKTAAFVVGGALVAWGVGNWAYGWWKGRDLKKALPRGGAPSLEEEYRMATQRRSSGRKKVFWGVFLAGAVYGAMEWVPYLSEPVADDFETAKEYKDAVDRRQTWETAQRWTNIGSGALAAWGGTQWFLGSRKMSEIEGTAVGTTAMAVPLGTLGDRAAPSLFAARDGGRTKLGLQWTW